MERLGFYVCEADLEDELIRALGTESVRRVVAAEGELADLPHLPGPAGAAGPPRRAQLRRFMGTRSGRKARYAPLLVAALATWGGCPARSTRCSPTSDESAAADPTRSVVSCISSTCWWSPDGPRAPRCCGLQMMRLWWPAQYSSLSSRL